MTAAAASISKGIASMGKSIAIFFACAALIILAGSFMAPNTVASSGKDCAPAYGVDPCTTASIDLSGN
jgi:peroxiredoxin family protein